MAGTGAPYPRQSTFPTRMAIFDAPPQSHTMRQESVTASDGAQYRLFTAVPRAAPGPAGYPVLYMVDGNAAFDLLTPGLIAGVPGLGVVGIGYDTPFRFDAVRRSLDFTPPRDGRGPVDDPLHPGRRVGGADAFLARLCGEFLPLVESRLPVDTARRALWGHSLGGLLTLYALLSRPGVFARYIAASPSVWWGEDHLLAVEAGTPPSGRPADVAVMLGEKERRSTPAAPDWNGPAPGTLELVRRLEARPGLAVSLEIFPGAVHVESLFASLPIALARAAAPA